MSSQTLSIDLKDVLIARVVRITKAKHSVTVAFDVRSVGHGTGDTVALKIKVPLNESRELSEHVQAAWSAALEGRYPSHTRDRDRLLELATGGDQGPSSLRATFSVFTPFQHRGPPPGLTWDSFAPGSAMDGGVVDRVLDEHFDWAVDCGVLFGTIPAASLTADSVDMTDVLGTLTGSHVAPRSVPCTAIKEVDARDVVGVLQHVTLPDSSVLPDHVCDVNASKIEAPPCLSGDWASNISMSACSGAVRVDALPMRCLRISPGLDARIAKGSVDSDMLLPGCVTEVCLQSVDTVALRGQIAGTTFHSKSIPRWAIGRGVDANMVSFGIVSPLAMSCQTLCVSSCTAGWIRVSRRLMVGRSMHTRAIGAGRVACEGLRALGRVVAAGHMTSGELITETALIPVKTACETLNGIAVGVSSGITSDMARFKRLHADAVTVADQVHSDKLRVNGDCNARTMHARAMRSVSADIGNASVSRLTGVRDGHIRADVRASKLVLGGRVDVDRDMNAVRITCDAVQCNGSASVDTTLVGVASVRCGQISTNGSARASHLNTTHVDIVGDAACKGKTGVGSALVSRARTGVFETRSALARNVLTMRSCVVSSSWTSRNLVCIGRSKVCGVVECDTLRTSHPIYVSARAEVNSLIAKGCVDVEALSAERIACYSVRCKTSLVAENCLGDTRDLRVGSNGCTRVMHAANVQSAGSDTCDAGSVITRSSCRTNMANASSIGTRAVTCHALTARSGLDSVFDRLGRLATTLASIGA